MRVLRLFALAVLAMAAVPNVTEAKSRWGFSFGYNSGGWCGTGGGLSIGYGYSYGYRPSFVYGGYYGGGPGYCGPAYYAPRYYAPAPPVYYSTPRFYDNCGYVAAPAYSAPVYYATPRFAPRSYVSVSYAGGYVAPDRGYTYANRGYSYVDRNYNYCPPAKTYAYSSYHRR